MVDIVIYSCEGKREWKWIYTEWSLWRIHHCALNVFWFAFFWSHQANAELGAVWSVGQRIWQRDFPGIYTTISAHQWSETIQPIMEALRGTNWVPVGSMALYVALSYFCVLKKTNRQVEKWQVMKNRKWSGRLLPNFCRFYLKDFRYQG